MFSFRRRWAAAEASRTTGCSHLDSIQFTELPDDIAGCEECLAIGAWWVHLRMCQSCGHIGCCDDSPDKHTSAHARDTGHPIVRYVDRTLVLETTFTTVRNPHRPLFG